MRAELEQELVGRRLGKIFQLSRFELAVDLGAGGGRYLFVSFEPKDPRIYLIRRRLRDIERQSRNPSPFLLQIRKHLASAELVSVEQVPSDRVLLFRFHAGNEVGPPVEFTLAVQLTGRSANLFLIAGDRRIIGAARENIGDGQRVGDKYAPPPRKTEDMTEREIVIPPEDSSVSEMLDREYLERAEERIFFDAAQSARGKIDSEIARRKKLAENLRSDLELHGDAEKWKRYGDLLLANIKTARRDGSSLIVTDLYDPDLSNIRIEADENETVSEAAERCFRRYAKARNAAVEIARRLSLVDAALAEYARTKESIERAITERDLDSLKEFNAAGKKPVRERPSRNRSDTDSAARRFISSDGFEILVGKKAKDNDFLTFRIAKSLDTWMHAADYPGSHVVIRNPNRREVPPRTLLEAAQLAAFYSQGRKQPKAAVHYTQKKFVNKPKGSAPGLVSLAGFKTLLVEPKIAAKLM
jgi:predicted ribosome quality control (RQC) complex YloA/Tae2 family protein